MVPVRPNSFYLSIKWICLDYSFLDISGTGTDMVPTVIGWNFNWSYFGLIPIFFTATVSYSKYVNISDDISNNFFLKIYFPAEKKFFFNAKATGTLWSKSKKNQHNTGTVIQKKGLHSLGSISLT